MGKVQVKDGELQIADKIFKIARRRIFYVGVGKCAISAGMAVEKILGEIFTAGVAFDVFGSNPAIQQPATSKLEITIGTHPLPSEANERGAKRIVEFLSDKTENDLVIFFISGGGSTLLCLPQTPTTYSDESELFKKLTNKGAPIQDLNTVRKHISRARGGALAEAAYPAEVISLIFSDVPGNDIHTIASGPTVLDTSTIVDAQSVLAKYNIDVSSNIKFIETPKDQKYFERVTNLLFLSNLDALAAMRAESARHGYMTTVVDDHFTGEAREVGLTIAEKLHTSPSKTALLYAGESTVKIDTGAGVGGRNQEMAISVLNEIKNDELILPFASDGHDNTDHAGAIADEITQAHAREKNLSAKEYLEEHKSYDFFKSSGDALITGYTGSNVSDLIIAIKK